MKHHRKKYFKRRLGHEVSKTVIIIIIIIICHENIRFGDITTIILIKIEQTFTFLRNEDYDISFKILNYNKALRIINQSLQTIKTAVISKSESLQNVRYTHSNMAVKHGPFKLRMNTVPQLFRDEIPAKEATSFSSTKEI